MRAMRSAAIAACSAIVVSLAACGSSSTKGAATTAAPSATIGSTAPAPASTAAAAAVTGTVTFWHAYSSDSPEVKTLDTVLVPAFQKSHPGVTVKTVAIPYDDLHTKLVTAAAGGELPDVVRSDIAWVPELGKLGVLAALDQELPDFKALAGTTYDGALATNKLGDHYYGLPLDTNTRVMMWNADALKAAGVTDPPKTFADLKALGEKLKGKGVYAFADGGTGGWNMLPWIWSGGGDITDPTYTKATGFLNGPKSVAAIQMLVDLYKAGEIPDIITGAKGGVQTSDGLPTGKYATILDGPWMFPIFTSQYPNFKLQTSPVPAGDGGSISVVGGEDVVLTKASKNKPAAEEWIRYLLSPEAQTEMAKVGQMSVRKDLGDQITKIHDYYAPFVTQLATARPRTPSPNWPKIDKVLGDTLVKAFTGDVTVQAALDDAAKQIDPLLAG